MSLVVVPATCLLPLELPAEPTAMRAVDDGLIVTFADHPPMLVRRKFGTLLGFVIEPTDDA